MLTRFSIILSLTICLVMMPLAQSAQAQDTRKVVFDSGSRRVVQLDQRDYILQGPAEISITHDKEPILSGSIDLKHEDAAIIFKHFKPSEVNARYLKHITVDGNPADLSSNIRLTPYLNGTIIMPHGPDYEPLQTFNQPNYSGDPRAYRLHKYYKSKELGEDEDQIASFILKRGYMATLAENEDGTGASQVFIANHKDLKVGQLPANLRGKVSFIRVFKWRWTGKKGYGGSQEDSEKLGTQWRYQWNANSQSTLDMEYVPMKHNANWPSFDQINSLTNVTHLLGFNEPMQKDQANMTVEQALKMWPKLQESGLRLGSPCPTDGAKAIDWVVEFVEKADASGYRIDFVTVHYYKADWTEKRLIDWLREIHERTGRRPLWVTEFNNGARWVKNHNPTYQENAENIGLLCRAMDRCGFVERYAVFNIKDGNRALILDNGELTPAGQVYRDNPSAEAYTGNR